MSRSRFQNFAANAAKKKPRYVETALQVRAVLINTSIRIKSGPKIRRSYLLD